MNLYNLTTEAKMIASLLETEELTPELEGMLVINQQELTQKSIDYAKVIRNKEADSDAIEVEIKRLKAMKDANDRVIDRMKQVVKDAMLASGIDKIESSLFKLSLRRSESVEVVNIDQLPESLVVVKKTVSPDKVKIKEQIKNGIPVEGAVIVENFNLTIK
jgi:hypothetical protein